MGNYSDNKDKHRNAFQHLNLAYKLTCKDTTVVLGQTLSDLEQEKVIREAQKFADTFQLSNSKHSIGENSISTGSPWMGLQPLLPKTGKNHFLIYIKAGLKLDWQEASNYSTVSVVSQGLGKNPTTFLGRLEEALIKHTNPDLESYEGQILQK